MRSKSLILLILALACGLVASIGITRALDQPAPQVTVGETKEILVAAIEIKVGEPITPQNLKIDSYPIDKVPEGAVTEFAEIEGRRARTKIYAGEPMIVQKLIGKDDKDDVLKELPPGMRAVAVKVDAVSGGAGLLKPGDKVDVIVHVNANPGAGILQAETIAPKDLRNLKVFAIDSVTSRNQEGEQTVVAKTISLVVTPTQAKLVTLSQNLGEIRLVGRNANDNGTDDGDEGTYDYNTLKTGASGAGKPTGTFFPPQPAPVVETPAQPEAPVAVAPAPNVNREVMVIREGAGTREIIFENGKPILTDPNAAQPEKPAAPVKDTKPEPAAEPEPPQVPPPALIAPTDRKS
jgi:pilus assembly protein CpaB